MAAALFVVFFAVAALGDKAVAPTWLRLAFGGLGCVDALAAGVLTWREHTESARIRQSTAPE